MEELINDEHISLDYVDNSDNGNYRLSIFDKNYHYLNEIYLSKTHLIELLIGLKNIENELTEDL